MITIGQRVALRLAAPSRARWTLGTVVAARAGGRYDVRDDVTNKRYQNVHPASLQALRVIEGGRSGEGDPEAGHALL